MGTLFWHEIEMPPLVWPDDEAVAGHSVLEDDAVLLLLFCQPFGVGVGPFGELVVIGTHSKECAVFIGERDIDGQP